METNNGKFQNSTQVAQLNYPFSFHDIPNVSTRICIAQCEQHISQNNDTGVPNFIAS